MDNMVANDQCYDAFAAEGMMLNNNIGYSQKEAGGTRRLIANLDASDILQIGDGANMEVGVNVMAKARAWRNGTQSIPNTTFTKIQLNAENYDIGGDFDAVTNYRFVAPITAYYDVKAQIHYLNPVAEVTYQAKIRKNDTTDLAYTILEAPAAHNINIVLSDNVYLEATDFIELFAYQASGGNDDVGGGDRSRTFMAVHLFST